MRKSKPSWWILWALVLAIPLVIGVEMRQGLSPAALTILQVATVVVGVGLGAVWYVMNARVIEQEQLEPRRTKRRRCARSGREKE